MTEPFVEMFKHNLWANLRLLDACADLSDDVLDRGPLERSRRGRAST